MEIEIPNINTQRNLLAFSAGVDSTALFFILLEKNIPFDIAIVNYNIREESKLEVQYAKDLAEKFNKKIYIKELRFDNLSNFEKKARDIRYNFFEELITKYSYDSLLTAHQLNDKLEWFLMQFSKGAGLKELLSFQEFVKKEHYQLIKPLINISRDKILEYLKVNHIKFFIDKTNSDEKYKRNYFRKHFSDKIIEEFEVGIKRSFEYLQNDLDSLNLDQNPIFKEKELEIFKSLNDDNLDIRIIDDSLKKRGYILSKNQRDEILKQKSIVISSKIAIVLENSFIYICPYSKISMNKKFKENCRVNKIPKLIRAYLFEENINDLKTFASFC